jgi:hypothetical protein
VIIFIVQPLVMIFFHDVPDTQAHAKGKMITPSLVMTILNFWPMSSAGASCGAFRLLRWQRIKSL